MTKFLNICNLILVFLIVTTIAFSCRNTIEYNYVITNNKSLSTSLKTNILLKDISCKENSNIDTNLEEKTIKNIVKDSINDAENVTKKEKKELNIVSKNEKKDTKQKVVDTDKTVEVVNNEPNDKNKSEKVIETIIGGLAGYGPDCFGCTSKKTSSGYNIDNGNIYYNDKEYGKVRIVAGDKKYPYGTIVKISNTNYYDNSPIYAIVLDRGGVGIGKKYVFDLLFESESIASNIGSRKNVTFDILRVGY